MLGNLRANRVNKEHLHFYPLSVNALEANGEEVKVDYFSVHRRYLAVIYCF